MPHSPLLTEAQRRRTVAWVLALTANTPLQPERYERQLLARYEQGELTLDQVSELLEASVYQILYRSRAATLPSESDLQRLLEQARAHNAASGITGLLLYSDSRYVQVLEGPEAAVQACYRRVLQDVWHTQVVTVREGPGPRRFPNWSMALSHVAQPAVARLLHSALAEAPFHGVPIGESLLDSLLEAFGVAPDFRLCEVR